MNDNDILERLRAPPTVTLPQDAAMLPVAAAIRQMMVERVGAVLAIEVARSERDELSADLARLREAVRVRPSKKAMLAVRETLEAMEAMDEEDAAALRLLVELYDNLENL